MIWTPEMRRGAWAIAVGTLVMDADFSMKLLDEGFTFVACGTDGSLLTRGSDALLAKVREAT